MVLESPTERILIFFNIRFVHQIYCLWLLFSSVNLSDFSEFAYIAYFRRRSSKLFAFLHEFCTDSTNFAWIHQNKIHTISAFANLLKLSHGKINKPKIFNKARMIWSNALHYIVFTAVIELLYILQSFKTV